MPDDKSQTTVRDTLIRARSALITCLNDTLEDLTNPARRSVIERRIRELTEAIAAVQDDNDNSKGQQPPPMNDRTAKSEAQWGALKAGVLIGLAVTAILWWLG